MHNYTKFLFVFFLAIISPSNAQGNFSHELGIIVGPLAFQSDYGERYDLKTNAGNTGFGVGLIHYLNFAYRADCQCYTPDTYFNDHFKFRTELSYNRTKLNHFGKWVTPEKVAKQADAAKLKAMEGTASATNIGMQIEFFPWSIRDFTATTGSFNPYISFGGQFSYYDPEVRSTLGKLSDLTILPKYWEPSDGKIHGYTNEGGAVWSIVGGVGTRYKLTPLSDLILDLRAQYYFSNWVDGLNPNPIKYTENKFNDWNVWLSFGYIYYL
jgi:hypothetical protein